MFGRYTFPSTSERACSHDIDFSAHSNYVELAIRELGVEAFPHVGRNTELDIRGKKLFPIVTGTFGMTDFLHSVVGEMGDKIAQSEVEDMESKLDQASTDADSNDQTSVLKEILDKVPWDLLEGDGKPDPSKADELKQAAAAKAEQTNQRPLDSNVSLGGMNIDEAKEMAQQTLTEIYPILEFHDQIMKGVNALISKVPGLDDLMENMSGALQIFIFSLLAPYIKPIISQARVELKATSEGVLKSSEKGQYEVFENESCTDPTHSMLSKDHFSNVLNPVAGQVACNTIKFVVPHIVDSWSDEGKDVRQTIDDILQVFHHPALRDENREGQKAMFDTVREWWESKDESEKEHLKDILSYEGVKEGRNHEGDSGEHSHSHGAPKKKKQEDDGIVPSAQEGASFLSGLAGGLASIALKETGLSETVGNIGTGNRTNEGRSKRTEETSYGQENQSSSYGRGNNESSYGRNEETSSYQGENEGSSYGRNNTENSTYEGRNNESSSHNRRNDNDNPSYGRGNDNETSYGRGNQETSSSYGGGNDNEPPYGHGNQESTTSYGRRHDNETSYARGNQETATSYGRGNDTYGDSQEQSERQGGNSYSEESSSSYGRSQRDNNEEFGRGGNDTYGDSQERSERRGGKSYEDESSSSYGRSQRDDNEEFGRGGNEYGESGRSEGGYGRHNEERRYGEDENSRF